MKLKLVNLNDELLSDLREISKVINIEFCNGGEKIYVSKLDDIEENVLEISNGIVKYKNKHNLFRAIGLYAQLNKGERFYWEEKSYIPNIGPMIDASRNAVYKVDKIKDIMVTMAVLGLNRIMLYTEDTYEVEGYEYFGYLRGRYSSDELREIDKYGQTLGIEVIPCIQTLAHLKQTLKWNYGEDIKDTDDVLLVGEEKTYEFIDAMIKNIKSCFRSKKIHIGMDEAFDLGRGEYLNKNGYTNHFDIMINHLNKVYSICKSYNLEPMMWDDMFFRAGAPNGFYYNQDTFISKEIAEKIPKDLSLVYWDYYHKDRDIYRKFFDIRKVFNNKVIFAGGIWKWTGLVPNYDQTFKSSNEAMFVCKEENIKEVIITAWGDDGDETPIDTIIPGLILFAEHAYSKNIDMKWIDKRCEFFTDLKLKDFFELQNLDKIESGDSENLRTVNPSKYLLYQDILLGAFDAHIENLRDLRTYYEKVSVDLFEIANKSRKYELLFKFYAELSKVLAIKSDIGIKIKTAYKNNNLIELINICDNTLDELIIRLDNFQNTYRQQWYKDCKGHGFEVIDIRLGGVRSRINSTKFRLKSYLNNEIDCIEELEDSRLYYSYEFNNDSHQISYNRYKDISTQSILSW